MWFTLFIVSLLINAFAMFYIRWLLNTLKILGQELEGLAELIHRFTNHVNSLYELEMFYGDETLKSLLVHGKALIERIDDIDFILNDKETDEEEYGEVEEETQENEK